MLLLPIVTAASVVFSLTAAYGQSPVTGAASCDLPRGPGVVREQLTSEQRQREYRLFVPPGYDGRLRMPLVLDLHGSGGTSADQAATSGFEVLGAKEQFVVATLDAEDARWNVPVRGDRADDVAYVRDVIAHAAARVCIDESRVYATGFSGGGRMASLLGCQLGSRLAAIAPVAGLRSPGRCSGRPTAVLTVHGLADRQNPYDGQAPGRGAEWLESVPEALAEWARYNSCKSGAILDDPPGPLSTMRYDGCAGGAEVRMIRIDGLGHTWTRRDLDTTLVIWQFFKAHRLSR